MSDAVAPGHASLHLAVPLPQEAIRSLCVQYQVRELSVFGSVLRDDFRPESDIDLLVEFLPEAHAGLLFLASLQSSLQAAIGRKVDLVPKGGLKPGIREAVLASARVLYAA